MTRNDMVEKFQIMEHIPFMAATMSGKFNWTRLSEAIIMAVGVGILTAYLTVQALEIKFEHLQKEVTKVTDIVNKMHPRKR